MAEAPMRSSSDVRIVLPVLIILTIASCFAFYYTGQEPAAEFFSRSVRPLLQAFGGSSSSSGSSSNAEELRRSLEAAAFRNRTVIITTLNKSWANNGTMIDLFLESFRLGNGTQELLDHLLIVNLDAAAQLRCSQLHDHCFSLVTEGVDFSGEKMFMSSDYLKMMWRRIDFLREVLQLGFSFVFTDADIMWLRDPFPRLSDEWDFEIACDRFNGDQTDLDNAPNGGFVHVVASDRTVELYKLWYRARLGRPGRHDQDVLNDIKHGAAFADLGLRLRFLDTRYIGGFCDRTGGPSETHTMHANCCTSLARKLSDLRLVLQDWQDYRGGSAIEAWSAPRECLHSWGN